MKLKAIISSILVLLGHGASAQDQKFGNLDEAVKIFKVNKPESCLKAFKINNLTGMFVYIYILSFSIL